MPESRLLDAPPYVDVPCLYCHTAMPARSFAYWPHSSRLVSAACPACARRVTLPVATWRRWTHLDEPC